MRDVEQSKVYLDLPTKHRQGVSQVLCLQLNGWLADWIAGRLAGCLSGWLAGWLTGWLADWLVGLLAFCQSGWLAGWLAGKLAFKTCTGMPDLVACPNKVALSDDTLS